jgi:hypothetical protein
MQQLEDEFVASAEMLFVIEYQTNTQQLEDEFVASQLRRDPGAFLPVELLQEIEAFAEDNVETATKRRRICEPRVKDFWATPWGAMLQNPQCRDPTTRAYRKFRRKFRMPADLFQDFFIPEVKRVNQMYDWAENSWERIVCG